MATRDRNKSTADQLREAISASGLSWYRISKETGLHESTLSKFMHGITGIRLDSADKIFDLLGLEVVRSDELAELRKLKRSNAKARK